MNIKITGTGSVIPSKVEQNISFSNHQFFDVNGTSIKNSNEVIIEILDEVSDVIKKTDQVMEDVKPDALLILGDTYSGLSIMPASYRGIKTFHMEAGLRAYDKRMPEQRNRILIDHMSDILLPYKKYHRENLIRENIHPSKIFVTGNTTFEAMDAFQDAIESSEILKKLNLEKKEYVLMSAHRSENVDDPKYVDQYG